MVLTAHESVYPNCTLRSSRSEGGHCAIIATGSTWHTTSAAFVTERLGTGETVGYLCLVRRVEVSGA